MKKILPLLLVLVICFVGCSNKDTQKNVNSTQLSDEGYYTINVEDNFEILIDDLENTYKEGTVVTVKLKFHSGANVGILVDGEKVKPKTAVVWEYEIFEFIMPNHDINLQTTFNGNTQKQAKSNEQFIYFDNELRELEYIIKFDYKENEDTLQLHEQFIENSGLADLNHSGIFYYKKCSDIYVYFISENDTIEVQEFMSELTDKAIISIEKVRHYLYDCVYMHNPLYYQLKETQKIPYSLTYPLFLNKGIYKSVDDIQDAIDNYFTANAHNSHIINKKDEIITSLETLYNDEYFEDKILVVTDTIVTGSGSNSQELNSVYYQNDTLYLFVKMYFPGSGTCDMQYTRFGLSIDKSYFDNIANIEQQLLYNNPRYDNHGLW